MPPGTRSFLQEFVPAAVPSLCALIAVARLLMRALVKQAKQYEEGNYRRLPEVDALIHLQKIIRAGVCRKTATFVGNEIPGMTPYLEQLPPAWRKQLVDSIVGEHTGCVYHAEDEDEFTDQEPPLVATNPQMPSVKPPQWPLLP